VHILQWNDQNLALTNMAKSANDNMMTRPHLKGYSGTPLTRLRTVNVWGDGSPQWVLEQSSRWGSRLGRIFQKLRSLGPPSINFKQKFSNPVTLHCLSFGFLFIKL